MAELPLWMTTEQAGRLEAALIDAGASSVALRSDGETLVADIEGAGRLVSFRATTPTALKTIIMQFEQWKTRND